MLSLASTIVFTLVISMTTEGGDITFYKEFPTLVECEEYSISMQEKDSVGFYQPWVLVSADCEVL